ncbi:MAG: endoribonuclease MazF [Bacillota bacterium]|nr:endoribonuclease MazF [Bacillota bacterium]MDW7684768.1 endoribonuclease MazF [Bacillota bacterium]
MPEKYIPSRGDVVWLEFSPQAGHEQAGHRPALCISPKEYNEKVGLAIFCPITSQKKGYPFEVQLPDSFEITGVILSDHVKNFDWKARNAKYICALSGDLLHEVLGKLRTLL